MLVSSLVRVPVCILVVGGGVNDQKTGFSDILVGWETR